MRWHCLKWTWCTNWGSSWAHNSCWNSRWLLWLRGPLGWVPVALIRGSGGSLLPFWLLQCPLYGTTLREHLKASAGTECGCMGCKWCQLLSTCIIFPLGAALVASVFSTGTLNTGTQTWDWVTWRTIFLQLFLFIQSTSVGWACTLGMHWPRNVSWQGPGVVIFCIVPIFWNMLPLEIGWPQPCWLFGRPWKPSGSFKYDTSADTSELLIGFMIIHHLELLIWYGWLYKTNK